MRASVAVLSVAMLVAGMMAGRGLAQNTGFCPGDCDGDVEVKVYEIIRGVNIALERAPLSVCASLDFQVDGKVTVDELVTAIDELHNGCGRPAPPPPVCGDGVVAGLEECDDGNHRDRDGCSASCEVEGPGPVDQRSAPLDAACAVGFGAISFQGLADLAQEFTPSQPLLSAVALRVDIDGSPGTLLLQVHAGTSTGPVVASATADVTARGWQRFDFAAPVAVTPGAIYVIQPSIVGTHNVLWDYTQGDASCAYECGVAIAYGDRAPQIDFVFRTYTVSTD